MEASDFKPGDCVKINAYVYLYQWEGYEKLWDKYGHHNLEVDNVLDMPDDIDGITSLVIVGYPNRHCNKTAVKPDYLWKT